ncbi:unnamed protein product [Rotaria socialis]|uniref:Isochorismatase-like domain-containing protein n=1 Tax=Rotaria socialis TaxID=392032 RepID=A0A819YWQ4_9BILA|nr:unnamed protein product [Rotaria socialis]CAF3411430.1 unnamed protein product [Rotaria socialis]CAF3713855.1 unnamed protein product [Rotaria socialis]CAF3756632.1 unnamed protein product [Rotaria socialis]CAF4154822.1 unnamed protein product [Rotaria socialis]
MAQCIARLSRQTSLLLLCDMQEKFRPTIKYFPQIIETSNKLLQVCKILDVPYVVTEQYPKGLGRTVSELDIGNTKPFEKTLFSMCTPDVVAHMKRRVKDFNTAIICGIEAHACVLQTSVDLLSQGYRVYVVVDAVSSRSLTDRMYAFDHMRQAGAFLTTFESIVLQLTQDAGHPKFKQIQQYIKTSAADTGLLALKNIPNLS